MQIAKMWRYPVKSMLGEEVAEAGFAASGVDGDRRFALIDDVTGLVATAKHPRLWRDLLKFSAAAGGGGARITSPSGWTLDAGDPAVDGLLSTALGRSVRMSAERPEAATVERPAPEDVLAQGVEAEVAAATLEIGQGSPGSTFVDYAPVHLITTATVGEVGTEHVRYRPNLLIETPPGTRPHVENDWVGGEVRLGGEVVLRIVLPTPRCAVPTLEHGGLPRDPHAVRALLAGNRVDVPGFGVLPCAGCYAEVVRGGLVRVGDAVVVTNP
ncbi:MOSC domain-containing protein [Amycolatopsis saalfeldensis]|uniref:MOSC domain-containing protein n=1 Tax=Amycolatopsis saalfeldensis TaxID=394193 RepID=A0A1H8U804_9PSEU|nr:MOSC N-terminal beta barrel domain-containing protein [Amycolatopsis saalfeldensis]SEO99285.1 hypothetical protein SAMN04489732_103118 [Amycolatopsis saalfeldensis]